MSQGNATLKPGGQRAYAYPLALTGAFLLGACLRLYLLKDQLLLDDEWHGLLFIKNRSLWEVLTQINPFQNSSPLLNIYQFLCYHGGGLTEWNIRLPLLVTGCALVAALPLLARRIIPARAGIIFSLLLALSPFLVFYSRFSRSYIIVALLSFAGLLAAYRWAVTGKKAFAALFILASVLAVYTHPSAVAMAAAPYAAIALALLLKRFNSGGPAAALAVTPPAALKVLLAHALGLAAVVFNYFSSRGSLPLNIAARGGDMLNTLQLICGTASAPVLAAFIALAVFGCLRLYKLDAFFALLLGVSVLLNVSFVLIVNPLGIQSGAVFLRYCIAIVPLVLLCAAAGVHELLGGLQRRIPSPAWRGALPVLLICLGVIALYAEGPLPVIYRAPNNFTGHLAFQGSYAYGGWRRSRSNHYFPSYEVAAEEVPVFYKWLAADPMPRTIIEYPFDFADHSDLLYFYQLQHRKRVLAGYCGEPGRLALSVTDAMGARIKAEKLTLANTRPEFFFSGAAVKSRTHFRNMLDIADDGAVLGGTADYLVLHKTLQSVYIKKGGAGNFTLFDRSVLYFKDHFARLLGSPVYEDAELIVFALSPAAPR